MFKFTIIDLASDFRSVWPQLTIRNFASFSETGTNPSSHCWSLAAAYSNPEFGVPRHILHWLDMHTVSLLCTDGKCRLPWVPRGQHSGSFLWLSPARSDERSSPKVYKNSLTTIIGFVNCALNHPDMTSTERRSNQFLPF